MILLLPAKSSTGFYLPSILYSNDWMVHWKMTNKKAIILGIPKNTSCVKFSKVIFYQSFYLWAQYGLVFEIWIDYFRLFWFCKLQKQFKCISDSKNLTLSRITNAQYPTSPIKFNRSWGLEIQSETHTRTLPIYCLYAAHTMPIHCQYIAHSLPLYCPCIAYRLLIHYPYIAHTLSIHCPCIAHALSIDCPYTAHTLPIHCPYTSHTLPIHCSYIAHDLIWFDLIWFDLIWFDLIWFGLIWFDLIWIDFAFFFSTHAN